MRNFRITKSEKLTPAICLVVFVTFLLFGCATQHAAKGDRASGTLVDGKAEVTSISLKKDAGTVNVLVQGSEPLAYTAVKQGNPLGVVLYFQNTQLNVGNPDLVSDVDPISAIHARQSNGDVIATRLEILLTKDVPYNVQKDGDALSIRFAAANPQSAAAAATPEPSVSVAPAPATASSAAAVPLTMAQTAQASDRYQGTGAAIEKDNQIWVNRIDFLGESGGRSTLSIETTAPIDYDVQKVSDRLIELRLDKANIAEFRQRPLITTRFESAVNRIMPVQLPSMKNFSMFSIELREPVAYYVEQVGTLLLVHFEASSVAPAPLDEANLPAWKKALEETLGTTGMAVPAVAPVTTAESAPAEAPPAADEATFGEPASGIPDVTIDADQAMVLNKKVKRYTGEKIALDFYQTDIKNVFRILREVSGKNFAIDKDVSGKVTLTLDKPVPWDQVMDLVLRMNQLGMIVEGDIIRIATLATLKRENELRKAQIASLQKEKEQIKALEPLDTRYIPISYSDAAKEVLPHIKNILTKDRGSVSVDSKNNQIIITDTAEKIRQAQEIARQIDKVTSQVIIEARIVEVSESYSKELGFEWGLDTGVIGINSGRFETTGSVAMNYPASTTNGLGINLRKVTGTTFDLDAELTALETNGHGKVLSSPKIVTLNNKKARIKQGQEYGYLERDSAGGSSVSFKDVDLLLEVTPHVTPDNRISMTILITKNDVVDFVEDVPVISTNEAQTELLVNDGDTIVIGGIMKSSNSKTKSAFPGLHKVPILGWMFQSNAEAVDKSELLIFMNPKIVQLEQRALTF